MSCTEIFSFDKQGNACLYDTVKNSWRGGMAIWKILNEKYIGKQFSLIDDDLMEEIWHLDKRADVSLTDKICLLTTLDKCLVEKKDIPKVIEAFYAFKGETSLKEQAQILEKMNADNNCIAVGWNQTSVNADALDTCGGYDEEKGECIPYNCLTGTEHWWLFKELEGKAEDEN